MFRTTGIHWFRVVLIYYMKNICILQQGQRLDFFFLFVFLAKQMSSRISGMDKNMIHRGGFGTPKLGLNLFLQSVEDFFSFPIVCCIVVLFTLSLPSPCFGSKFVCQICFQTVYFNLMGYILKIV